MGCSNRLDTTTHQTKSGHLVKFKIVSEILYRSLSYDHGCIYILYMAIWLYNESSERINSAVLRRMSARIQWD